LQASADRTSGGTWISEHDETALEDRVDYLSDAIRGIEAAEAARARQLDQHPKFALFGRAYLDTGLLDQDELNRAQFGAAQGGTRFRSTRLGVRGALSDVLSGEITVDFLGTETIGGQAVQRTGIKNAFLQVKELPLLQTFRIGHVKEPVSLEEATPSRCSSFLERSVLGTFIPVRNMGIRAMANSEAEDATFAIGVFREPPDVVAMHESEIGGTGTTMRGTWLPWYDEATEGRGLLHLGGYYSYRDVADGTLRFRRRADTIFNPYVVDTGMMTEVVNWHLVGAEAAVVFGPLSVQSEYAAALVNRSGAANPGFDALYVEVSYFLTGEHRVYNRTLSTFGRLNPIENAFRVRDGHGNVITGKGAWQLAYRYGYIDLIDTGVNGNRAGVHTMGVNWYLTPYARLMAHYTYSLCNVTGADHPGGAGNSALQAMLMRLHFDF
jgi:phosphate-selective porin OprO/OprP